jgi:ATP-dependent Clp protease adaptor protein ClpS
MSDIDVIDKVDVFDNTEVVERVKLKPPVMWNVILLNDNFSSMELVVLILMQIFHKSFEEAQDCMMHIHENGKGIAGTYSHEVASTKRDETIKVARANESPLVALIEPNE